MRLFLAINIPADIRSQMHHDVEALRMAAPDIAWVRPERLHFTLKFLGEVPAEQVGSIQRALLSGTLPHESFTVMLAGVGAFPNFHRPRVVWIGVPDHRAMSALASDVVGSCEPLGFERDARGFSPHVTLGRVRRNLSPPAVAALERAARAVPNEYAVEVGSVDLMRSDLSPNGPTYTVVASVRLGARMPSGETRPTSGP